MIAVSGEDATVLNDDTVLLDKAMRVIPGDTIYVEPSDTPTTGDTSDSVVVRLFESVINEVTMTVGNLEDTSAEPLSIPIDRRQSLQRLRELIAEAKGVDPESFKVCVDIWRAAVVVVVVAFVFTWFATRPRLVVVPGAAHPHWP